MIFNPANIFLIGPLVFNPVSQKQESTNRVGPYLIKNLWLTFFSKGVLKNIVLEIQKGHRELGYWQYKSNFYEKGFTLENML